MAFDDTDRKWYYDELKKNGYNTGTYDDFKRSMNNKVDRDWYYGELQKMGYNTGSAEDFENAVRTRRIMVGGKESWVSNQEYKKLWKKNKDKGIGGTQPVADRTVGADRTEAEKKLESQGFDLDLASPVDNENENENNAQPVAEWTGEYKPMFDMQGEEGMPKGTAMDDEKKRQLMPFSTAVEDMQKDTKARKERMKERAWSEGNQVPFVREDDGASRFTKPFNEQIEERKQAEVDERIEGATRKTDVDDWFGRNLQKEFGDEYKSVYAKAAKERRDYINAHTTEDGQFIFDPIEAEAIVERAMNPEKMMAKMTNNAMNKDSWGDLILKRIGMDDNDDAQPVAERTEVKLTEEQKRAINNYYSKEEAQTASELQNRMMEEYKNLGAPQSVIEYIGSSAFHNSLIGTIADALVIKASKSSGLRRQLLQQATAEYGEKIGKDGGLLDRVKGSAVRGGASFGALALDAVPFALTGAGGSAIVNSSLRGVVGNVTARALLANSFTTKLGVSMLSSGLGFSGYEGLKEAVAQSVNPNGYDVGAVAQSAWGGFKSGAALGGLGFVGSNWTKGLTGWEGGLAKVGTYGAEVSLLTGMGAIEKAIAEGKSVTDIDWNEVGDDFMQNAAMVGMFRIKGLLKDGVERTKDAYKYDMEINSLENEYLKKNYGIDFSSNDNIVKGTAKLMSEGTNVNMEGGPKLVGKRSVYTDIMEDPNAPIDLKRKMTYIVNGQILTPAMVADYRYRKMEDGSYQFATLDGNGRLISINKVSKGELINRLKDIKVERDDARVQAQIGLLKTPYAYFKASAKMYAEETGIDKAQLDDIVVRGLTDGELNEQESRIFKAVNDKAKSIADRLSGEITQGAINYVASETGIDLTDLIYGEEKEIDGKKVRVKAKKAEDFTNEERSALARLRYVLDDAIKYEVKKRNFEGAAEEAYEKGKRAESDEEIRLLLEDAKKAEEKVDAQPMADRTEAVDERGEGEELTVDNTQPVAERTEPVAESAEERGRAVADMREAKKDVDEMLGKRVSPDGVHSYIMSLNMSDEDKGKLAEYYESQKAVEGFYDKVQSEVENAVAEERKKIEPYVVSELTEGVPLSEPQIITATYEGEKIYITKQNRGGDVVAIRPNGEKVVIGRENRGKIENWRGITVGQYFDGWNTEKGHVPGYTEKVEKEIMDDIDWVMGRHHANTVRDIKEGVTYEGKNGKLMLVQNAEPGEKMAQIVEAEYDEWGVAVPKKGAMPRVAEYDELWKEMDEVNRKNDGGEKQTTADAAETEAKKKAKISKIIESVLGAKEEKEGSAEDDDVKEIEQSEQLKPIDLSDSVKPEEAKLKDNRLGRSLTDEESNTLLQESKNNAINVPDIELTTDNWLAEFGEEGTVQTPITKVKMGENQYFKLAQLGRNGKLGMIKPTLADPDFVIEEESKAKDGKSERESSHIYVRSFIGKDGTRTYHFTSVTVNTDGQEVSISNQEKSANRILNLLKNGKLIYVRPSEIKENLRSASDAQSGESVLLDDSQTATNADNTSVSLGVNSSEGFDGKDTNNTPNNQTFVQKNAPMPKKKAESKHEKMLKEMGDENYDTLEEFVLRQMGGGKIKFRWKAKQSGTGGLGTHTTGEGARGDMMAKASMLDAVNGTTPEEYAEKIMDDLPGNLQQYDVMDVTGEVIDALLRYNGFNQMVEAAYDLYKGRIEREKQAELEAEEEARDQWAMEKGFADYKDMQMSLESRRKAMEKMVAGKNKGELQAVVNEWSKKCSADSERYKRSNTAKNMRQWVCDWESLKVAQSALRDIDKYSEEEGWFGNEGNTQPVAERTRNENENEILRNENENENENENNTQPVAERTGGEGEAKEEYRYRINESGRKEYTIVGADGKVRLSSFTEFAKARKAGVEGVPSKAEIKRINDVYRLGQLTKIYKDIKNAEEAENAYEAVSRQLAEGNYDEDAIGGLKLKEKELKELSELMNNYPTEDGEVQFMVKENRDDVYSPTLRHKEKQMSIISETNPMVDDIHTGVRSVNDIKTYSEAVNEGDMVSAPDYTEEDIQKALSEGKVKVYSSYPIENGVFVTPSKMEAKNYAGGGKVYEKEVELKDVAWIDTFEGQYAKVEDNTQPVAERTERSKAEEEKKRVMGAVTKMVLENNIGKDNVVAMDEKTSREEFEKVVGKATFEKAKTQNMIVWHGSAAKFDKFDLDFAYSGEGSMVNGHGVYVSSNRDTAERYASISQANKNRRKRALYVGTNGYDISYDYAGMYIVDKGGYWKAREAIMGGADKTNFNNDRFNDGVFGATLSEDEWENVCKIILTTTPNEWRMPNDVAEKVLYKVDIPEDLGGNYFGWEDIISKGVVKRIAYEVAMNHKNKVDDYQINKITDAPKALNLDHDMKFSTMYGWLSEILGGEKEASALLNGLGYDGVRVPIGYNSGNANAYKGEYNYVVFNEDDVKIANRAEFMIVNEGEVAEKPGQVFYSNAERALGEIQQKKGSGEQWINMLKNKGGLKAEEDKWIGLSDFLRGKKSVSKDEILEYINENKLEVVDVEYSNATLFTSENMIRNYSSDIRRGLERGLTVEDVLFKLDREFKTNTLQAYRDGLFTVDKEGNIITNERPIKEINDTRLHYTTSGLSNKKEIALVVPTIESYNQSDDIHFGDAGDGRAVAWLRMGDAETLDDIVIDDEALNAELESAKIEFDNELQRLIKKYNPKDELEMYEKASQEENDLLNLLDGRIDALMKQVYPGGGKRVLVIDEVQSKRHQDGRENGYKDEAKVEEARREREEKRKELDDFQNQMYEKYGLRAISDKTQEEKDKQEELEKAWMDANDNVYALIGSGVPDAPFRNNWHELAMKRALRYAVENGYDKLAWTSGEQQARRYDLGKAVKSIFVYRAIDPLTGEEVPGMYDISTYDHQDNEIFAGCGRMDRAKMVATFGKEIATKLADESDAHEKGWASLESIDGKMTVGDMGMKGFYDKMLPSFMGKYVKKWGGKVGEVELRNVEKDAQKMWSVDITDEMRKSVMEGQPQFFTDKRGKVYGWTKDGKIYLTDDGINANTPVHEYTHLWAEAVMKKAPELWKNIKELLKDCGEWKKVMSDKNYRNIWGNEDKVASEVLSRLSGREHERRMSEEYDRMIAEADGDIVEEAKINRLFRRMKEAVNKFWEWVGKNLFGIKEFKSVEDVVNRSIYDYYEGTDLKSGEVPGGQRNVNDVADKAKNKTNELKNKYKGQRTEDILVSLSGKNGEIDYEKAREIGRRVTEGEVRVKSEDGRVLGTTSGALSQGLQAIYRGIEKTIYESNGSHGTIKRGTEEEIAERYAREMGCFYDEDEIFKLTDGRELLGKGGESLVYKGADGKSVIKYTFDLDMHEGDISKFLRDLDAFNRVFPYSKCEVVGFGRHSTWQWGQRALSPIIRQEYKEGMTVAELAEKEAQPYSWGAEMIDEWMDALGFEADENEPCTYENANYIVKDLHQDNVISTEDGGLDAIDAQVKAKDEGGLWGYEYEDVEDTQPVAERTGEERKKDEEYMKAVESGDMKKAQEMVLAKADEQLSETLLASDADEKGFKYHRGAAPKKVRKMYAVLNVNADGLHAAYAGNKGATPVGVWLDAQNLKSYVSDKVFFDDGTPVSYIPGDTGKSMKEAGIDPASRDADAIGKSWLLERGGKHGSDVPNFSQMNTATTEDGRKTSKKQIEGALPSNKLVFEIECGMDEDGDLTEYVKENGRMLKGKNQGLAKIEPNKFYFFKTNPNAVGNWGLAGTFRVMRLVPHDEIVSATEEYKRAEIEAAKKAYEDGDISKKDMAKRVKNAEALQVQKWIGGYHPENYGLSVEMVDKMYEDGKKMKLTDAVTYDDNGEVIPLSERFNSEVEDARFMADYSAIDEEYMKAVEGGDEAKMREMIADAVALSMPKTKVVGEDGKPEVVYHGTQLMSLYFKDGRPYVEWTPRFNKFNEGKGFFTRDKKDAESFTGGRKSGLYECYLNITNPFVFDCKGQDWDAIKGYREGEIVSTDEIVWDVKNNHPEYDGVIIKNVYNENSGSIKHNIDDIIPLHPNQIKLAETITRDDEGNVIPLSERFGESDDIRFMIELTDDGNREMWEKGKANTGKVVLVKDGTGAVTYGSDARKVGKMLGKSVEDGKLELNGGEWRKVSAELGEDEVAVLEFGDEDGMMYKDEAMQMASPDVDYTVKNVKDIVNGHPEAVRLRKEIDKAHSNWVVDGSEENKEELVNAIEDYSDYMQRLADGDVDRKVTAGARKVFAKEVEKAQEYLDNIEKGEGKKVRLGVEEKRAKSERAKKVGAQPVADRTEERKLIDASETDFRDEKSVEAYVGHKVDAKEGYKILTKDAKYDRDFYGANTVNTFIQLPTNGWDWADKCVEVDGNINSDERGVILSNARRGDINALREIAFRMAKSFLDDGLDGNKNINIIPSSDDEFVVKLAKEIAKILNVAYNSNNLELTNIQIISDVITDGEAEKKVSIDYGRYLDYINIVAFAEDIKGDTYKIGNNSVTLSLEDSEMAKRQSESLPKVDDGIESWTGDNGKLQVQSAKLQQRFPILWDRAKKLGDPEAAWMIGQETIKDDIVARMVNVFPDAHVAYPHREVWVGQNRIADIYAETLRRYGLEVNDDIVMTERAGHTGASRFERLVRRARFSGEVEKGRQYIIVDDHTTSGATMRDMKDYIESKGGVVVMMTSISASRGSTFLAPRHEDIVKLKELGVTDEQVRKLGIAQSLDRLTSREVQELIVLARKGQGQDSRGVNEEVSSRYNSNADGAKSGNGEMAPLNAEERSQSGSDRRRGQEIGYVEGSRTMQDIANSIDFGDEDEYDIVEMARRLSTQRKSRTNAILKRMEQIEAAKPAIEEAKRQSEQRKNEGVTLLSQPKDELRNENETRSYENENENEGNAQPVADRTKQEEKRGEEKVGAQPVADRTKLADGRAEQMSLNFGDSNEDKRVSVRKAKAVQMELVFGEQPEEELGVRNEELGVKKEVENNAQPVAERTEQKVDAQPVADRTEQEANRTEQKVEVKTEADRTEQEAKVEKTPYEKVKEVADLVGVDLGYKKVENVKYETWRDIQDKLFERWQKAVEDALAIKNKKQSDEAWKKAQEEHRELLGVVRNEIIRQMHAIDAKMEDKGMRVSSDTMEQRGIRWAESSELLNKRMKLHKLIYAEMAKVGEIEQNKIVDVLDYAKFAQKRNYGIEEVDSFEKSVPNSATATYALNTAEEVEMLRKSLPAFVVDGIAKDFADENIGGTYIPSMKVAIVYPQKLADRRDVMAKIAHENTHYAIDMLNISHKDMVEVLNYIRDKYPWIYAEVSANYDEYSQAEEAVTHLIEELVAKYGLDAILNTTLSSANETVNKTINNIINYWKNGNRPGQTFRGNNRGGEEGNEGTLQEMRNASDESNGRGEAEYKRAIINSLGDEADDADDPRPMMPELDENENIFDESYAEKMEAYREALAEWNERNRGREIIDVDEALYRGDATNVRRATGVEALDTDALDEAERFDAMMNGAKIDVSKSGLKRMIRDEILERRRTIEVNNWEDAVMVHNIRKKTTAEQRKQIPFLLEDTDEAKLYPELADVLKEIRDWFDEVHKFMSEEGLFTRNEQENYITNYCTHIWDFERSEPKTVEDMKNWIRTNSPYTQERVIATLNEGLEKGLKMKYEDITDIMLEYGHYATEAVANRRLINFLKGFKMDGMNIFMDDKTKDADYVRIDNNALDGLKVYKGAKPLLDVIFGKLHTSDNVPLQKIAHAYDISSGVMKKINLSLSFFHHGALTETAVSMMGVPKFAKSLFKNMIWDAAMEKELPAFLDTDVTMDAVKHFVSLGATQDYAAKDVQGITADIRKFFTDRKIYGLREGAVMADWVNKGMDLVLWDWMHDGYKIYAFKKLADEIRRKAKKNGWNEDKTNVALDEAGQLVNDTFGGQHWDLLGWSPNTVKWARRLLLSPDWTISTIRQALSPFGIGQLYNDDRFWRKWFKKDDVSAVRRKYGRLFWLNAALIFIPFYNLLNAYYRKKDEEEELAKAEEIRKTEPNYKSSYELAYPNGMKWYEYTMLGNTMGHNTHLFGGRYANGTEMYIRWGKQFRELPELFFGRDGFSFPGPIIDKMAGKLNPMLNTTVNMVSGYSLTGWENPFMKNRRGWEKEWGRLQTLITSFTPYSIPTDNEKEFVWTDLMMPSTKGFSAYKAKMGFETAIKSGDIDLVGKVYEACMKNSLDANELWETASKSVEATARKSKIDGIESLSDACNAYDKTDVPAERATYKKQIGKWLSAQDWEQIERADMMEKAMSVINGDVTEKGSIKRYDMMTSSEDVIEDWRLTKAIAGLKQWKEERDAIRDSEGTEKASLYMLNHKDVFDKLKKLESAKNRIAKMKKAMGHGDEAMDRKVLEDIRKIRKDALR